MKQRPDVLKSETHKVASPLGSCYITIAEDEGEPFEAFVNVKKSGSQTTATAEAIGRLISLVLRIEDETPRERITEVIDQLEDIGGGAAGIDGSISSIPDAVSIALSRYMEGHNEES